MPVLTFIAGRYLPAKKFNVLGRAASDKIPESLAKFIVDRLDVFEDGLLKKNFLGDYSVVSNSQVVEEVAKVKVDLGLKE